MNPIRVEARQAPLGRVDDEAAERPSHYSPLLVQPPLLVPRDAQLLFASRQINQEPRLRLAGEHLLSLSDPGVQLVPGDQVLRLLDDPADVAVPGQLCQRPLVCLALGGQCRRVSVPREPRLQRVGEARAAQGQRLFLNRCSSTVGSRQAYVASQAGSPVTACSRRLTSPAGSALERKVGASWP
jgi:hypothetical protein